MHRKETFGTSGPRIQVRLFGGWGYDDDLLNGTTGSARPIRAARRWAATCRPPGQAKAPSFVVWAVKDPTAGNLDRIQIIKGWTKHGQSFEKIYDVVWSGDRKPDQWTGEVPPIQSTVDIDKATYTNSVGSTELKTVWTDPDFDPSLSSIQYQVPRYSTAAKASPGAKNWCLTRRVGIFEVEVRPVG